MTEIAILIPAAGASLRMEGRDKLLEQVDGQPLLLRQVRMALGTGAPVLVALPPNRPDRFAALRTAVDDRLDIVTVQKASEGMAASIRAGAEWAKSLTVRGLMILPADMPNLQTSDLKAMMHAFANDHILRATDAADTPGHPVIFPKRLFFKLTQLQGDTGARDLLQGERVVAFALPDDRATLDLDTPEAWADWRQKSKR